jgi:dolichyl-phosphate beta-glucosyltransferase
LSDILLTLVMPAYNEGKRIGLALEKTLAYLGQQSFNSQVIVVDDGSRDNTMQVVEDFCARTPAFLKGTCNLCQLRNETNRGKGYSIRRGVAEAEGRFVGFADADYKTPIEEFDKILPWLQKGWDVVIGSRGLDESRVEVAQPIHRRLGSRAFGAVMHLLIGLPEIRDTQCGFKFFERQVALDVFSRQQVDGYMFDVESLAIADGLGYRIKQVPIRWHNDADSRYQVVSGTLRNFSELMRIRLRLWRNPPGKNQKSVL